MCGKRSVNLSVCGPLSLVTPQSDTFSRLSLIQTNVSDSDTTKVCAIDDVANILQPEKSSSKLNNLFSSHLSSISSTYVVV